MHPILARRGRLVPYLAATAPLAAVLTALLAGGGRMPVGEAAALAVPMTILSAFLSLSAFYPCRATPLESGRLARLFATHGTAALLVSAVWVFLGAGFARAARRGLRRSPDLPDLYALQVPALFAAGRPPLPPLRRACTTSSSRSRPRANASARRRSSSCWRARPSSTP